VGTNYLFIVVVSWGFSTIKKGLYHHGDRTCRTDKNTDGLGLKGWAHSSCPPCARPFLIARFRNIWSYGRRPRNLVQLTEFNPQKNIWRIGLSSTPAFSSAGSVGARIGSTILGQIINPPVHSTTCYLPAGYLVSFHMFILLLLQHASLDPVFHRRACFFLVCLEATSQLEGGKHRRRFFGPPRKAFDPQSMYLRVYDTVQ
jgi:hypothetical protein